jgi:hypothetical protein
VTWHVAIGIYLDELLIFHPHKSASSQENEEKKRVGKEIKENKSHRVS